MRDEARRLESDADGLERLERQRRAIRCNSWTDKATGMGRWSVTLDPATWLGLENRLDAQIEAMFHDTHPEGCPTDLLEKQSFLRAHALLALLNGDGARVGRPEIVVVEDHTNPLPDGRPRLDWGADVDLPARVLRPAATTGQGLFGQGPQRCRHRRTRRVEPRAHDTAGQPGPTPGAARAVRHAVRSRVVACATRAPSCITSSGGEHGGRTDLENLLPVCEKHHQHIHHDGWLIALGPNRQLSITLPDGQVMTTGPPKRSAA